MVNLSRPPIDPLTQKAAIVDKEGRPTAYFIRQWIKQRQVNVTGSEVAVALDAVLAALAVLTTKVAQLFARKIDTTAGQLTGGGDLSEDRELGLADTAVTPATYGDATNSAQLTIDQKGRVTAAENVPISGGGGGGGSPPSVRGTLAGTRSIQTTGFAMRGRGFRPNKDYSIHGVYALGNSGVSSTTLMGHVVEVNGFFASAEILDVLASSPNATPSNTITGWVVWTEFASPVTIEAGKNYMFLMSRTDSTGTAPIRVLTPNAASEGVTLDGHNDFYMYNFDTTAPTVGQTSASRALRGGVCIWPIA